MRAIADHQWAKYLKQRGQGGSIAASSRAAGFSERAAYDFEAGKPASSGTKYLARVQEPGPGAVPLDQLCDRARRALDDFGMFRRVYFGRKSTPWQEDAGHKVLDLLETEDKEFTVFNAPPGGGKSTLFTHDVPAWITCRRRHIRGLFGSAARPLASRYVIALRTTLESPFKFEPNEKELELGLAVEPEAVLVADYGIFRPVDKVKWTNNEFIVAQHGGRSLRSKEPTWSAYGPDTAQIGGRYDLVVWDDLEEVKQLRTVEAITAKRKFWDGNAEKRLEPGGLMILQGQRLSPDDIYGYNKLKESGVEADHEDCCEAEPNRRYHFIRYRAHYEELCRGDHGKGAAYWPAGCLLDPRRVDWATIEAERNHDLGNFLLVYQQEDAEGRVGMVDPLWVSGGTDPRTLEHFIGCWDDDRDLCELPEAGGPLLSVASTDPSPTNYWGVEWWAYSAEEELRYLLDLERRRMGFDEFFDYNLATRTYGGLMESWWQRSKDLGAPITHWILEENAAQKFMLQSDAVRRWARSRNVRLLAHQTQRNKHDKDYGVGAMATLYRQGKVRFPGSHDGTARTTSLKLIDEAQKYPRGAYTDCLMAQWFFELKLPDILPSKAPPRRQWRPSWMAGEGADPAARLFGRAYDDLKEPA